MVWIILADYQRWIDYFHVSGVDEFCRQRNLTMQEHEESDLFEEGRTNTFAAVQMVSMPVGSVNTLYPVVGDMVGNIMLVALAGLAAGLVVTWKRRMIKVEAGPVSA